MAQAQVLREDWHKQADTAYYINNKHIIAITKDTSIDSVSSKMIALHKADSKVLKLVKAEEVEATSEIIKEETLFDPGTNHFTYYVAIDYVIIEVRKTLK